MAAITQAGGATSPHKCPNVNRKKSGPKSRKTRKTPRKQVQRLTPAEIRALREIIRKRVKQQQEKETSTLMKKFIEKFFPRFSPPPCWRFPFFENKPMIPWMPSPSPRPHCPNPWDHFMPYYPCPDPGMHRPQILPFRPYKYIPYRDRGIELPVIRIPQRLDIASLLRYLKL